MSRIPAVLFLLIALTLGACGKKSSSTTPPPPTDPVAKAPAPADPTATPSDAELDKMFAQSLDFIDAVGDAMATNTGDCKAMAQALDGIFSANKDLQRKVKSYDGNAEVDAKADAYMTKQEARVIRAQAGMQKGAEACGKDPDFEAVMKRFDEM